MMEDHLVPFLKKWKVGFGFLGEQGAESILASYPGSLRTGREPGYEAKSIHARFNNIRRNYTNMPNTVTRLEAILKEHLSQVCPKNIVKLPAPNPRKKKEEPSN